MLLSCVLTLSLAFNVRYVLDYRKERKKRIELELMLADRRLWTRVIKPIAQEQASDGEAAT